MKNREINFGILSGLHSYSVYRIPIHVLLWIIYLMSFALLSWLIYPSNSFPKYLLQYSLTVGVDILATYFTVYYLIPVFLLQKRYLRFTMLFLLSAILFVLLQRSIIFYITYPVLYPDYAGKMFFFRFNYVAAFLNIYVMAAIFASVKLFEYWLINQKKTKELETEKLEAELKFLKSQIHPHFLFNTLNNLYALTLDKSDQAPEVVVKLSDLLSYMLYECNTPLVPVEKEIKLIEDYLSLEKIRYKNEIKVDFEVMGRISGKSIPPLLLLPLIENGFKHGLSRKIDKPWINILLDIKDLNLVFSAENNLPKTPGNDHSGYTEGIGLKNVRRRLDLIYGEKYKLDILKSTDIFSIRLELQLQNKERNWTK